MPLERRRDGEKIKSIPLTDWNLMTEAARAYHAGKYSTKQETSKKPKDAGIFTIGNAGSSAIEIFSTVGLEGLPFTGVSDLLNRVRFKTDSINPERVAILATELLANCGTSAVYDGLSPCRIKLNRDPSVFHSRATPVAGETYMLADEIGYYDVLWHSDKQAADAEVDAEQGDIVYAIVRLGQPVRQWVSVEFDFTDGIAIPDLVSTDYIYSGKVADKVIGSVSGSYSDVPCWILFDSGCLDMQFYEAALKLDGYFHGFYEKDDETRPLITVPRNPITRLFGKWVDAPGDEGEVEIWIDRSTQLGDWSVTADATIFGNVSAVDAWVIVEYLWNAASGWKWHVTGEACGDA